MFQTRYEDRVTVIRGSGELTRDELSEIAELAACARHEGRMVVLDFEQVTHLHYAGATLLKSIRGLRAAGANRYVRNLFLAGGAGGFVELFSDVKEALRAA